MKTNVNMDKKAAQAFLLGFYKWENDAKQTLSDQMGQILKLAKLIFIMNQRQ